MLPEFAQAFLLQPVSDGGMLSEDELVFFSMAVVDVHDKYVKMKKIVEKGGRVVQYNPKKKMIPRGKNPQSQSNAS
jgi:hypothetical protein